MEKIPFVFAVTEAWHQEQRTENPPVSYAGDYYRAAEVEKRIAELESELLRLREIVTPEDVESIDRVLGESHGGENDDIGDPR